MKIIQKKDLVVVTLLSFAILTTMTVMEQQAYGYKIGGDLGKIGEGAKETFNNAKEAIKENTPALPPVTEWEAPEVPDNLKIQSPEHYQDKAGAWSKDKFGYDSMGQVYDDAEDGKFQKLEQSETGKVAGDVVDTAIDCRSMQECKEKYSTIPIGPITFPIPPTPFPASLTLNLNLQNIQESDAKFTIGGFEPKYINIKDDFTIESGFETTLETLIREWSYGSIQPIGEGIDEGKKLIQDTLGVEIGDLAKFKMDLKIKLPIPQSVNDLTSIKNYIPQASLAIQGCYNKISQNLELGDWDSMSEQDKEIKDVSDWDSMSEQGNEVKQEVDDWGSISEQGNEVQEIINDPNKAFNKEDECTKLV